MFVARNSKNLKQLVAGAVGILTLGLAAQAQVFTGSISFVGGATINNPIPGATTFTSFYGPGGTGTNPQVQGGQETGAYAGVPGGTSVAFTPFTFSPSLVPSPVPLWSFTLGPTTYSFQITSVTTDTQNVYPGGFAFLNIGGVGTASITGYAPDTAASWSITGTTANSASVTITIGNAVNGVPEPSTVPLMVAGLLVCGLVFRPRLKLAVQRKA
jgi:PEP-CTERM motif-containing protein